MGRIVHVWGNSHSLRFSQKEFPQVMKVLRLYTYAKHENTETLSLRSRGGQIRPNQFKFCEVLAEAISIVSACAFLS